MSDGVGNPVDALARVARAPGEQPRFHVGQFIRVLARDPIGHYRVPTYVRGRVGSVEAVIEPRAVDNEAEGYGLNAGCKLHYYRIAIPLSSIWLPYAGSLSDGLRIEVFETWLTEI
jgi:hypothetical protein